MVMIWAGVGGAGSSSGGSDASELMGGGATIIGGGGTEIHCGRWDANPGGGPGGQFFCWHHAAEQTARLNAAA